MTKGYVHRVYQFVAADFAGFSDARPWTRLIITPGPLTYPLEMPESPSGEHHAISEYLYQSWQRTFAEIVAEAIDQVAAAGGRPDAVLRDLRARLVEAQAMAWDPARPLLIRSRPPA